MSVELVLEKLLENNVKLTVKEDKLLCKLPDSGIDNDLLNLLKSNKEELKQVIQKKTRFQQYQEIPNVDQARSYPLTPSQKRLWLMSQFEGGSEAYNMSFVTKLAGDLHLSFFEEAFLSLINRYEILRTQFIYDTNEQEVRQFILPTDDVQFTIYQEDFSKYSDCHDKVEQYLILKNKEAFNLESPPLFKVSLLKIAEKEYVLLLNIHHIISDGWSMEILISEIVQYYNDLLTGQENSISPPKIQYKDYTIWLGKEMQKQKYLESEKYWLEKFKGDLGSLNLPSEKKRPSVLTFNGDNFSHTFSNDFTNKIESFSDKNGVTLFVTLMSAVKSLLYRYSNQEDITVGMPISGREHPDLESQIGLYVNTLAIRTHFNKSNTFLDVLQFERDNLIEAKEHQIYSFDELVRKLNHKKDLSRSPLFDIMVVYQNQSLLNLGNKKEDVDGLSFHKYNLNKKTSQFDITFNFSKDNNQKLQLNVEYNTDIYTLSFIEKMVTHFEVLSLESLENPRTPLLEIDYLTRPEREQLLFDFNNTSIEYPEHSTLIHLFEKQVIKTPEDIAIVFGEKKLTYKELNGLSNQFANYLRKSYLIGTDDLVTIKLEPSELVIVSIIGVLKSGAAYIPIDLNYPLERINFIENDSNSKVIIDQKEWDQFCLNKDEYSSLNLNKKTDPSNLAYVIYTSGTTGQPKGVMIEHSSLSNYLLWAKNHYLQQELSNTNFGLFTSLAFDLTVSSLFLPLISGGYLKVFESKHIDKLLLDYFSSEIACIKLTPSHISILGSLNLSSTKIQMAIIGGEALSKNQVDVLLKLNPSMKIYNEYGPTESTVGCIVYEANTSDDNMLIGKPIANTEIYILNDFLGVNPIGVYGEINISGFGLAQGYLNRLDLTSEKFINNPHNRKKLMYKTGDLGRWLSDGNIEFLGRNDNQIKVRGHRIELSDIENVILKYSTGLKQVIVDVKEKNQEKVLVAYLVSSSDIDKSELRAFLQQKLPEYMVPVFYIVLDDLPLTPNGKIDKRSLPDISENDAVRKEYIAPKNDIEKQIAAIWEDVLSVSKIGVNDNFFELGGHSLVMAQIINRIHKQLGQTLSFNTFFQNPTILNLSGQLQTVKFSSIPKAPQAESYPLTSSQNRLWILSQMQGGSLAYNMLTGVRMRGDIDVNKLNESFLLLIEQHEVLRTYFKIDKTRELRQYVLLKENINFKVTEKDFSDSLNQEEDIASYLQETNNIPYNLEQVPLLRAYLIKIDEDDYVFFMSMHHIIGDGWSVQFLLSEAVKIYNILVQGKKVDLPTLDIQYKDYSVWLNETLEEESAKDSEKYWLQKLEGDLPAIDLPSSKKRPIIQTYNGDNLTHHFSQSFLEKLKHFSKDNKATLFMTLMSGVKALLHRYTGLNDLIVGTPIAGREHPDLENQIGLYLNTLAIRTRLQDNISFLDLLALEKKTLLEAYDHQSYPFDSVVDKLNLKRDTSRSALFDILVVLQSQGNVNSLSTDNLVNLEVSDYHLPRKTSQFDITYYFVEAEVLSLTIEYNTDVYDEFLIERMFSHFENFLERSLAEPETVIQEIDYLTDEEREELLFDFNKTKIDYPKYETILDLFEEQAKKVPNNIAIEFEDTKLTYKDLNEQSNQFANYLQETYAIVPNDLVGVKLDRSERMLITIFGILKSGAAYVPIDVNYPAERVTYIFNDANLKLCVDEQEIEKFTSLQSSLDTKAPKLKDQIHHLAYCIYTSGSTGNPKGVLNHHAGLYNRLVWMKNYLNVTENDVFLQKTPYTFDVSVWELILPFISGSKLIIARPGGHKDVQYLEDIICKGKVSIIHFVPSMLSAFLSGVDKYQDNCLSHIVCSGEELSPNTAQECKDTFGNTQLHNLYGPTEASIDVTAINLTEIDVLKEGVSIGKPIANTCIYIVNDSLELQPVGVAGELLISGIQVARGYLNLPELTSDRFIKDPFNKDSMVYRTGDIAYWKPDGSIEYVGRIDNQVKIRGNRIEIGEIEKVITKFDGIKQAIVVPKVLNDEKALVAYYLLDEGINVEKSDIRNYLQLKLPEYMHPSFYIHLEDLPVTSNGKINRKALPNVVENDLIRREYVAPKNEFEEKLIVIWREVLGVEKIGVEDDFFELGGHSLKIIKLYESIRKDLSENIDVFHLFSMTTIRQQAQFINTSNLTEEENTSIVEIDF